MVPVASRDPRESSNASHLSQENSPDRRFIMYRVVWWVILSRGDNVTVACEGQHSQSEVNAGPNGDHHYFRLSTIMSSAWIAAQLDAGIS